MIPKFDPEKISGQQDALGTDEIEPSEPEIKSG